MKVTDSIPWYVNIVNFMVSGYVPPGENKKKLIYESRLHLWDDPYLYRVPAAKGARIIENFHATPYGGDCGVFCTQAKI